MSRSHPRGFLMLVSQNGWTITKRETPMVVDKRIFKKREAMLSYIHGV